MIYGHAKSCERVIAEHLTWSQEEELFLKYLRLEAGYGVGDFDLIWPFMPKCRTRAAVERRGVISFDPKAQRPGGLPGCSGLGVQVPVLLHCETFANDVREREAETCLYSCTTFCQTKMARYLYASKEICRKSFVFASFSKLLR